MASLPLRVLRSRRTWFWISVAVQLLVVVGLLVSFCSFCWTARFWVGGFNQEEYRITFKDRGGRPVQGVRLRVENESGSIFHHFPVTDYLPGQVPTSDADGVLTFHHAPDTRTHGCAWWLFGVIPMGDHSGPVYVCRFQHRGREVHHVRYNDLVNTGRQRVKRRWKWLTTRELQEMVFQVVSCNEEESIRERAFDLNGDGRLDREEVYAARAAEGALHRAFGIAPGRKSEWEELAFRLVVRDVVLDLP